ncbi:MAG: signal peptidase I [Ruminococcus sp.]
MKKKLSKIVNVVVTVLIVCVLIVSVLMAAVALTSRDTGVPNVLGKATISVLTDSMAGEDALCFNAGDMIICDVVSEPDSATYKVGDVVTFQQDIDYDGVVDLVTHRIYKVNKDGTYLTKGDSNETYDQDPNGTSQFPSVSNYDIVATYHGMKIPGIGNFFAYIRTPEGFFLCVLLPMILFFLYEAVRVVINIIAYNKEKAIENAQAIVDSSVLTEEQKKRAIEEYLASQGGNIPQDTDENSPTEDIPTEDNSVEE